MKETQEHILWWIDSLIRELSNVDIKDLDIMQTLELTFKLQQYLIKLGESDYE